MLVGIVISVWDKTEKLEDLVKYLEKAAYYPHKYFKWLITKQNVKHKSGELKLYCDSSLYLQKKNPFSKFNFEIYIDGHIDELFEDEYDRANSVGSLVSSNHS
jgi:hypothetical protein